MKQLICWGVERISIILNLKLKSKSLLTEVVGFQNVFIANNIEKGTPGPADYKIEHSI